MYKVTYSHAHVENRCLGIFESLAEAVTAAEAAGAMIADAAACLDKLALGRSTDASFSVREHEDSDDYAIWIERQ